MDTHPIHFHAFDVQLLNRVTWDNIIIPPDPTELGWKDTIRISPLEDTIVALRPVIPTLPFDLPNSIRKLNPIGAVQRHRSAQPLTGRPRRDRKRDFRRPARHRDPARERGRRADRRRQPPDQLRRRVRLPLPHPVARGKRHDAAGVLALAPKAATGVTYNAGTVNWTTPRSTRRRFSVQTSTDGTTWTEVNRIDRTLTDPAMEGTGTTESVSVGTLASGAKVRVVAENTVGDTFNYSNPGTNEIPTFPGDTGFPHVTATAASTQVLVP